MKAQRYTLLERITLLTLLLTVLSISELQAQETDHVYLKSGSVIRGNIMEIEPAHHVKIQDLCGNIWFYKVTDVEKITSEPFDAPLGRKKASIGFEDGFVNMTSIGFLAGSSMNGQLAPFTLQTVNGYLTSGGIFAGVGTGIEFFSTSYLPLFLDLRYELFGTDVVPYLLARGGYGVPLAADRTEYSTEYEYQGGPLLGAGIGLKIKTREHLAWDISLLFRYQETSYSERYDWNEQIYEYTDIYRRLEIRLGFYID